MKKIIIGAIALMVVAGTASASLGVGWDGGTGTSSSTNITGFETSVLFATGDTTVDGTAGSNDGTYGPLGSGASTGLNAYKVTNGDLITVVFKNTSGGAVVLDSFVFDYSSWFANSPTALTLTYVDGNGTGGIQSVADGTVVASISGLTAGTGKSGDYADFEWSFSGLAGQTMNAGAEAKFTLQASDGLADGAAGGIDNVAVILKSQSKTLGLFLIGGAQP